MLRVVMTAGAGSVRLEADVCWRRRLRLTDASVVTRRRRLNRVEIQRRRQTPTIGPETDSRNQHCPEKLGNRPRRHPLSRSIVQPYLPDGAANVNVHLIHDSFGPPLSPHPKRQLDRFSRFSTVLVCYR